jgi:hypothetical protein
VTNSSATDLSCGVAGVEKAEQAGAAPVVETFVGSGQQPASPMEGIDFAAPMAQHLILDATSALVEFLVGQAAQMKRVGDLDGVGQHGVDYGPIRSGQIESPHSMVGQPLMAASGQPPARPSAGAAFDHVEQPAVGHIDNRGRPGLNPIQAQPAEQRLVEAQGGHRGDTVGVVDERFAVGDHRVVAGVPSAAQLAGYLGHRPAVAAHLHRHPPPGPVRQRLAGRSDRPSWTDRGLLPQQPCLRRPSPTESAVQSFGLSQDRLRGCRSTWRWCAIGAVGRTRTGSARPAPMFSWAS